MYLIDLLPQGCKLLIITFMCLDLLPQGCKNKQLAMQPAFKNVCKRMGCSEELRELMYSKRFGCTNILLYSEFDSALVELGGTRWNLTSTSINLLYDELIWARSACLTSVSALRNTPQHDWCVSMSAHRIQYGPVFWAFSWKQKWKRSVAGRNCLLHLCTVFVKVKLHLTGNGKLILWFLNYESLDHNLFLKCFFVIAGTWKKKQIFVTL